MIKRRHHYVWQKYLEPWTVKKGKAQQLWLLRRDAAAPLKMDTKNVAVEKDFYRLTDLTPTDSQFIRWLAFNKNTNPRLRELNEGWIKMFEDLFGLQKLARHHPNVNKVVLAELDKQLIELQEDAYSSMESAAAKQMAALVAGDVGFLDDDNQAVQFCFYLTNQYFRTKAIRDRIREQFSDADKPKFDRTWPILRYIFATNVGYAIFANRKAEPLQIMQAPPGTEFITSDQPAINTLGAFAAPGAKFDELELYYPVSPIRALIISGHATYKEIHGKVIEPFRVNWLNQAIELVAHEQLFAKSEESLKGLQPSFCKQAP